MLGYFSIKTSANKYNVMKDQTKIIAALLVGAAAGAAIGLLLAPSSGSELREDIADYVNDLAEKSREQAKRTADSVREYGNNVVDKAKERANSIADTVSTYKNHVIGNVKSAVNDYADQAVEYGGNIVDGAKSGLKNGANSLNNDIQNS